MYVSTPSFFVKNNSYFIERYFIFNKLAISGFSLKNVFSVCYRKMEIPFRIINAAAVASPMQLINELSVEYNFTAPNYEVTSINLNNNPTFIANCMVIKDC